MANETETFSIMEDCVDERLKIMFRSEEERKEKVANLRREGYRLLSGLHEDTIKLPMEYFEKFKAKFPLYEYKINYKREGFKKIPESFSVWYAEMGRNITVDQYLVNELER